ncbi:hypothetical protein Pmani_014282 [Petrolisthes manimaculis]|uniref:Uncharacterized protein n=1 Tax=Petrolisthes manimaculis TaxID=1843537 RepID=A0AAE1PUM9_9EUCA|nr:hypothetical protein Pmani_014282 [Petrolisthes manimaculis]
MEKYYNFTFIQRTTIHLYYSFHPTKSGDTRCLLQNKDTSSAKYKGETPSFQNTAPNSPQSRRECKGCRAETKGLSTPPCHIFIENNTGEVLPEVGLGLTLALIKIRECDLNSDPGEGSPGGKAGVWGGEWAKRGGRGMGKEGWEGNGQRGVGGEWAKRGVKGSGQEGCEQGEECSRERSKGSEETRCL